MRRELVFIALGFGVAAASGLFLAVQVSSMDAPGIAAVAGGTFLVAAPLISFGVYGLLNDARDEAEDTVSMMRQQREFMDVLRSRGQMRIDEMAAALDVAVEDVQAMFRDLIALQVFSGYVHEATIYYAEAGDIQAMTLCKICQSPLESQYRDTFECPVCTAAYYVP